MTYKISTIHLFVLANAAFYNQDLKYALALKLQRFAKLINLLKIFHSLSTT